MGIVGIENQYLIDDLDGLDALHLSKQFVRRSTQIRNGILP